MWFEQLMGFREESPEQVRSQIDLDECHMTSKVNGRAFVWGKLETPSLGEARLWIGRDNEQLSHRLRVQEVVADIRELHLDPSNAGALFQVASQFNLLEMVSPTVTPEQGVGIYQYDRTQGPVCAVAAGAGTIYRNYFAPVNGEIGQRVGNQIDCLSDLGLALGNTKAQLWEMCNGYALATEEGLKIIAGRLADSLPQERDRLKQTLRIGLQTNTQVTIGDADHTVSQAYCSALPVAYSRLPSVLWAEFAKLVLESAYEATLLAGLRNYDITGNNRVFLTLLGGGAFGNDRVWILDAIRGALEQYRDTDLEIILVSYGRSDPYVRALCEEFKRV